MGSADNRPWRGYIVHAWMYRNTLRLAGRLHDDSSFAAVIDSPARRFFAPDPHGDWSTFDGQRLTEVSGATPHAVDTGLLPTDEYLLFSGIKGTVKIDGIWSPGRRVARVFRNPHIMPSDHQPSVLWASIDIETDREQRITAISIVCGDHETVLFLDDARAAHDTHDAHETRRDRRRNAMPEFVRTYDTEAELLTAFAATLREWDPDIVTGWNVLQFDFAVLDRRFAAHGIAFDIGRAEDEDAWVRKNAGGRTRVSIPGRQVVDAMRIVRGSGRSFTDYRLDTVAHEVLGEGKPITETGEDKLTEIERLRRDDPAAFCRYCLNDSRLVLRILAETGLDALTLVRSTLTGLPFNLAWTSIPAFENIYALELISRRILPPRSASTGDVSGAAGGTVLDAIPGLFQNVLVFDFRSLYPSVMRTFNIDPLGFARTPQVDRPDDDGERHAENATTYDSAGPFITAPNGARFSREPGILPVLLDAYFASRENALATGDTVAAFVYKILMNSFYGVLGSSGCMYGRKELAGAITGFGRYCLLFARDFFQNRGMSVLYGDTDSVFVYAAGENLSSHGDALAEELNTELTQTIWETYRVHSKIAIRCDVAYRAFLLPRLRGAVADETIRGRAKGYAGLVAGDGGDTGGNISRGVQLDIKGMEAARSDYTPLAQRFQRELLELLFNDAGVETIVGFVRDRVARLQQGHLDDELVYRKILRRPAEDYRHAVPPQVRAARKLGWTTRRGRIEYVMTTAGPEPVQMRSADLDYRHYIDHQLRPIWLSIAEATDLGDSLVRYQRDGDTAELITEGPGANKPSPAARLQDYRPLDDQLELGL